MSRALVPVTILLAAAALHCDKPSSGSAPAATTTAAPTPPPPAPTPSTPPPATAAQPTPAPGASVARLAPAKIPAAGKSAADRVAKAYVDALKTGTFTDAADLSEPMKKVTPAQWQQILAQTKAKYGPEKSMDFVDAWNDEKGGTMYRYKASFAKADKVEFRVDLDGHDVATKFGTYDWVEGTP